MKTNYSLTIFLLFFQFSERYKENCIVDKQTLDFSPLICPGEELSKGFWGFNAKKIDPTPQTQGNLDSDMSSSSSSVSETLTDQTPATSTIGETEIKTLESQTPIASISSSDKETLEDEKPEESDQTNVAGNGTEGEGEGEEDDEEEGECGFCLFMKGGGCKDNFVAWEKCIEEGEKNKEDIVEKCFEVTSLLKKCMEAHSDYYAPILEAEKAAEAEVVKEIENEKDAKLKDEAAEAAAKEEAKQES